MSHRIKHSLWTKHKTSMWALINPDKRLAAGGSWSPGTNMMNQEEVVSDMALTAVIGWYTY